MLVIVVILYYRRRHRPLARRQVERRPLTMVGNYHRQPTHILRSIVAALRIDAKHTVGQLHRRECRYEQMTDITNIRVDIVYRFFRLNCCRQSGCQHQDGKNSS